MGWGQMGPGMMGPGMMAHGWQGGGYGCPGMGWSGQYGQGQAPAAQIAPDSAKELAQTYASQYLQGFTVDKVLPFTGMGGMTCTRWSSRDRRTRGARSTSTRGIR